MDLKTFNFPNTTSVDVVFSTQNTIKDLLSEAKERGFYNGYTPYNQLFSNLFFNGGKVKFKQGIDEEFRKKAWAYSRSFISSWEPSHEDKEAICALIFSEILEPELAS